MLLFLLGCVLKFLFFCYAVFSGSKHDFMAVRIYFMTSQNMLRGIVRGIYKSIGGFEQLVIACYNGGKRPRDVEEVGVSEGKDDKDTGSDYNNNTQAAPL